MRNEKNPSCLGDYTTQQIGDYTAQQALVVEGSYIGDYTTQFYGGYHKAL